MKKVIYIILVEGFEKLEDSFESIKGLAAIKNLESIEAQLASISSSASCWFENEISKTYLDIHDLMIELKFQDEPICSLFYWLLFKPFSMRVEPLRAQVPGTFKRRIWRARK